MITVNKDIISTFKPCKERFDNYLDHYSDFNGTFNEFLDLTNITYDDKIWVTRRLLNKSQLVHFAILCAESVLHVYDTRYLNDKRVSDCLSFMKTITDFSNLSTKQLSKLIELRDSAYNAASAAYDAASASNATYAAYATAYATAYAASAYADDATTANNYTAAYAAAYAADAASDATNYTYTKIIQQNLNLQFLKRAVSI